MAVSDTTTAATSAVAAERPTRSVPVGSPVVRRPVLLALAVAQAAGAPVFQLVGSSITTTSPSDPRITPAGWAFSIWILIVALSLAYALYQLPERRGEVGVLPALRTPMAAVFVGFNLWLAVAALELGWTTALVFGAMLALLVRPLGLVHRPGALDGHPRAARLLVRVTIGAYAGWATIGVFANIATALADEGLPVEGGGGTAWQLGVLASATVVAVVLALWARGPVAFAAAATWALVAVAVGAAGDDLVLAAGATAGAISVATATWVAQRRGGAAGAPA